jgi:hypothetical protein
LLLPLAWAVHLLLRLLLQRLCQQLHKAARWLWRGCIITLVSFVLLLRLLLLPAWLNSTALTCLQQHTPAGSNRRGWRCCILLLLLCAAQQQLG